MQRELFITSVFNVGATQQQDPQLWKHLEERFAIPYQRMRRYRYLELHREQKVLDWTRKGMTVRGMAERLVEEGLHPLKHNLYSDPPPSDDWERANRVNSAVRVVNRIRERLRSEGLIKPGKPGRPRKMAPEQ